MKKKVSMKICAVCAVLAAAFAFTAAAYAAPEPRAALPDPVYAQGTGLFEKELFFGAWGEPDASDASLQRYKDAGFNVLYLNNKVEYNTNQMKYYVEQARKLGLSVMVANGLNRSDPVSLKKADKTKLDFNDYSNVIGIAVCDEPQGDGTRPDGAADEVQAKPENGIMQNYRTIYDYLADEYMYMKENYNHMKIFDCILALGDKPGDFGYGALEAYVSKVLSKAVAGEGTVCFDSYPYRYGCPWIQGSLESMTPIMGNLNSSLYRIVDSTKQNKPKYRIYYYQQEWFPESREFDNADAITYMLYTAMCYGYNAFTAYMYSHYWFDPAGTINYMSTPYTQTEYWYYNKAALEEVKTMQHVYLTFCDNWQGTMFFAGSENVVPDAYRANSKIADKFLPSYAGIESLDATEDTIVGCYKDADGRDGYMIASQSNTYQRRQDTVNVKFAGATRAVVADGKEVKTVNLTDGALRLELKSGGGAFVVPLA